MGDRPRPGSGSRLDGGDPDDLDVLDQFGVGQRDPLTGLYESYDIPTGHRLLTAEGEGRKVTWVEIFDNWDLIIPDWSAEYGHRLVAVKDEMRWPEFRAHLLGLLSADTRLSRNFQPKQQPDSPGGDPDAE